MAVDATAVDTRALILDLVACWNAHDAQGVAAFYHSDFVGSDVNRRNSTDTSLMLSGDGGGSLQIAQFEVGRDVGEAGVERGGETLDDPFLAVTGQRI